MRNIAKFNFTEIKTIFTRGELFNISSNWEATGVSTDSRTLEQGNIFVAILGEKFDGHNSINEAFLRGASAAIVSSYWYIANRSMITDYKTPVIVVDDTVEALGLLANFHRNRFNYPIIAVAGSNGKTTTKDIIASVLSVKYKVLKTYKNYNNRIGVALMLLQLSDAYNIAVFELGTNRPGEMENLTEIVEPTDGLITNIGLEHLEMLIDIYGVEIEETYLFGYLDKKRGRCFINKNDDILVKYEGIVLNHITFGIDENAEYSVKVEFNAGLNPILFLFNGVGEKRCIVQLNSTGIAVAYNAVAAAAAGYGFGLTAQEIAEGLSRFTPDTSNIYARMVVENHENIYVLNDCYNANPSSMELSLQTLHMFKLGNYKIATLGDMFELGTNSHQEHIKVIKYALELVDEVAVIGQNMRKAAYYILEENNRANLRIFNNYYEIATYFRILDIKLVKSAVILIKGSREMEMEKIIQMMSKI
jgi:UDP-N-acetylmuramoyl-tripeptide--D-alanyl-D-alanine ligase